MISEWSKTRNFYSSRLYRKVNPIRETFRRYCRFVRNCTHARHHRTSVLCFQSYGPHSSSSSRTVCIALRYSIVPKCRPISLSSYLWQEIASTGYSIEIQDIDSLMSIGSRTERALSLSDSCRLRVSHTKENLFFTCFSRFRSMHCKSFVLMCSNAKRDEQHFKTRI